MAKHTLTFSTDNDYQRLELILKELQEMLEREEKRMNSCDFNYEETLREAIDEIDAYVNYEPSDAELTGEPPISADERHSAAWAQHQELHR